MLPPQLTEVNKFTSEVLFNFKISSKAEPDADNLQGHFITLSIVLCREEVPEADPFTTKQITINCNTPPKFTVTYDEVTDIVEIIPIGSSLDFNGYTLQLHSKDKNGKYPCEVGLNGAWHFDSPIHDTKTGKMSFKWGYMHRITNQPNKLINFFIAEDWVSIMTILTCLF